MSRTSSRRRRASVGRASQHDEHAATLAQRRPRPPRPAEQARRRAPVGSGDMKCPVCDVALSISSREGVEIDFCPQCRGVWLDRGELDKVIERAARPRWPRARSRGRRPRATTYDDRPPRGTTTGVTTTAGPTTGGTATTTGGTTTATAARRRSGRSSTTSSSSTERRGPAIRGERRRIGRVRPPPRSARRPGYARQ